MTIARPECTAVEPALVRMLAETSWHLCMVSYGYSFGGVMQLALHGGDITEHQGLICSEVSYYRGPLEGGPYRLACSSATVGDQHQCSIADEHSTLVVTCASIRVDKLRGLVIVAGQVDVESGAAELERHVIKTGGSVVDALQDGEWHVGLLGYSLSAGRVMELGFNRSTILFGEGLLCRGVSYWQGPLEGGPYKLRVRSVRNPPNVADPSSADREMEVGSIGGELLLRCQTVELGKVRYRIEI